MRFGVQGDKARRLDSVEDPAQNIRLLNQHPGGDDFDDDGSLSDGAEAVAETAFDSPPATATIPDGEYRGQTPTTDSSQPSSTGVKEPQQNAMKLPLDQTEYLQPQSSLPATYLDLVASPGITPITK